MTSPSTNIAETVGTAEGTLSPSAVPEAAPQQQQEPLEENKNKEPLQTVDLNDSATKKEETVVPTSATTLGESSCTSQRLPPDEPSIDLGQPVSVCSHLSLQRVSFKCMDGQRLEREVADFHC